MHCKSLQRLAVLRFILFFFNTAIVPDAICFLIFEMTTNIFCRPNSILHICQKPTLLAYNCIYKASQNPFGLFWLLVLCSFLSLMCLYFSSHLYKWECTRMNSFTPLRPSLNFKVNMHFILYFNMLAKLSLKQNTSNKYFW